MLKSWNYTLYGAEVVNYRHLVIGGPADANSPSSGIYRGDSFICAAAIHAGMITDKSSGYGWVSVIGTQKGFPSNERNGTQSICLDATFPLSFTFTEGGTASTACKDSRWHPFSVSVLFGIVLCLFTTSSALSSASSSPAYSSSPHLLRPLPIFPRTMVL